jgi:hypothetical protein
MFSFLSWYLRLDWDLSLLGVFIFWARKIRNLDASTYIHEIANQKVSSPVKDSWPRVYNPAQLLDPDDAG